LEGGTQRAANVRRTCFTLLLAREEVQKRLLVLLADPVQTELHLVGSRWRRSGTAPWSRSRQSNFRTQSLRETWISDKGMQVLQFWSDSHRETPVDMFVRAPFPFDEEYARALVKPLGAVPVRFVSIPTLIEMKTAAGRAQDMIDIENPSRRDHA
jgi:hypothetical protein